MNDALQKTTIFFLTMMAGAVIAIGIWGVSVVTTSKQVTFKAGDCLIMDLPGIESWINQLVAQVVTVGKEPYRDWETVVS